MIFGENPIRPSELVGELNRRATETAQKLDPLERNTAWTAAVKQALAAITEARRGKPYYIDHRGNSEFLLDFVWWDEGPSGKRALLGAECEWGNPRENDPERRAGAVIDDFEKLLQFKAPLKLMVFGADNPEMQEVICANLQKYLRSFAQHVQGETYVFVDFAPRHVCCAWTCEIARDGRDEALDLKGLDLASVSAVV